ncbi:T9SS type A sorting domain-containing protein [Candidatus Cloacimonadota bacterium]
MKRFYLITALIIFSLALSAIQNWELYTNTTHIYDAVEIGDRLYLATWGGLLEFDIPNKTYTNTLTNIDGLSDIDIRAVDYLENNDQLLVGTYNSGIDRIQNEQYLIPLTETIGLASNTVNCIISTDSQIFVGTKYGLSVFQLVEDFPFPLLLDNFDASNGLSANSITSLQLTDSGYLFCGSEAGIDYIDLDELESSNAWTSVNTDNSPLPDNRINSLSINGEWMAIGSRGGLAKVQVPDLTNWIIYEEVISDTFQSIHPVFLDQSQNLWFSYGYWEEINLDIKANGNFALGRINTDEQLELWIDEDLGINTNKIMKINQRDNGDMMLLTWGESIVFFEDDSWTVYETNSISASLVREVIVDSENRIWTCNGYIPPPSNPPLPRGTAGVSCLEEGMWTNYNSSNSPLMSDNIFSLAEDQQGRKWFGSWYIQSSNPYNWTDGISIFTTDNSWSFLTSEDGIRNDAISDLFLDDENNMWISSYGGAAGGVTVVDADTEEIMASFQLYNTVEDYNDALIAYAGEEKSYFGGRYTGLRIWNDNSYPYTDGPYWAMTPFSDLQNDKINDIISVDVNGREELWVASDNGLFTLAWSTYFNSNGSYIWYKYGTVIKRKAWYNNGWFDEQSPEFWYIEGQERIYSSVPTYPNALFADPFDRIWIGSEGNGISVYNMQQDTFTNYNMSNSPLISNRITDFAYDKYSGKLYIGTDQGLHSVEIGIPGAYNTVTDLNKLLVYPNPFYPDKGEIVRIENKDEIAMPKGDTECRIYDLAGDLIIILDKDVYEQFSWDGTNSELKNCSSGIYFYVVSSPDGQTEKGKIVLIR